VTHPLLRDPARKKVFELLIAVPTGTEREWAEAACWSRDKMRRFLSALVQAGIISRSVTPYGSTITVLKRDSDAAPSPHTARTQTAPQAPHLGSGSYLVGKEPSATATDYSRSLITAMNDALTARFPEYRRVKLGNKSSLDAAARLELAGVPIASATKHLEDQVRGFNPSTHGNGDLPRSLAYFERGVRKAYEGEAQLTLLPKLEMQVVPRVPEYRAEIDDQPRAGTETIAAAAEDWRAVANSAQKPQRMK
jgi:hypothetical protein